MSRIVVTGANGFVGYWTIKRLLQDKRRVHAVDIQLDRYDPKSKTFRDLPNNKLLSMAECDIVSPRLEREIRAGDKIIHFGAIVRFGQAEENMQHACRVNVEGTLNVVLSGVKKRAERIVFSSTGSVYDVRKAQLPISEKEKVYPENAYGLAKKQGEDWIVLNKNQLPFVILRYPYIYGPLKDWGAVGGFFKNLKENKAPTIFGGDQSNDFTYIFDIVEANLLALDTRYINQIFNIGTGRPASILDVAKLCIEASGIDMEIDIEPARTFDFIVFIYNINKAKTFLKYTPKWSIHDGITDMARRLRNEGYFDKDQ